MRVVQPGADSAVVTAGVIGVQREAEGSVIAASGCDVLARGAEGHRERGAECQRENDDYRETEDQCRDAERRGFCASGHPGSLQRVRRGG